MGATRPEPPSSGTSDGPMQRKGTAHRATSGATWAFLSPTQGAGILVFKDTTLVLCSKRLSHFKNGLFIRAGGRAQESAGPEAGAMERTGFLLCVPCCLDTGVEVGRGRGTFQLPPLRGISGVYCFILAETVETLPFRRAQKACLLHPTGEQVSG